MAMASVLQYFSGQQNAEATDLFRIIKNQSLRSWKFDSAAVYFVSSAANKLKLRIFFALTLTLRMTPGR